MIFETTLSPTEWFITGIIIAIFVVLFFFDGGDDDGSRPV